MYEYVCVYTYILYVYIPCVCGVQRRSKINKCPCSFPLHHLYECHVSYPPFNYIVCTCT